MGSPEEAASPANRQFIAAIARPGDTVLIGFTHSLTEEDIDALDESFRPVVDSGIKIGYMDQVTSMVIVRPDADDEYDKEAGA